MGLTFSVEARWSKNYSIKLQLHRSIYYRLITGHIIHYKRCKYLFNGAYDYHGAAKTSQFTPGYMHVLQSAIGPQTSKVKLVAWNINFKYWEYRSFL
jgi:hypothetical protein